LKATPVHNTPLVPPRSALSGVQVNCLGPIKTKFHSKIDLTATAHYEALHPTFHEFEVNTGQDPEDLVGLFEDENMMERGDNLPGCLEQSDYSDSGDDTTDSEAEFDFEQEQCWGYAKRIYRLNPESSREDVLERNALSALEAVPLDSMRKFATRSQRFMDAYSRGLNGRQAAWAARKYRGHRMLPESIMNDLEKASVV